MGNCVFVVVEESKEVIKSDVGLSVALGVVFNFFGMEWEWLCYLGICWGVFFYCFDVCK